MVNRAVALSAEFNELHREFPLLLRKTEEAPGFVAHAILGFEKDENLFVEGDRWTTRSSRRRWHVGRSPWVIYAQRTATIRRPTSRKSNDR